MTIERGVQGGIRRCQRAFPRLLTHGVLAPARRTKIRTSSPIVKRRWQKGAPTRSGIRPARALNWRGLSSRSDRVRSSEEVLCPGRPANRHSDLRIPARRAGPEVWRRTRHDTDARIIGPAAGWWEKGLQCFSPVCRSRQGGKRQALRTDLRACGLSRGA